MDAGRLLVGAPNNSTLGTRVGQAYLIDATTGALLRTFNDPTVTIGDRFGTAVALDGDRVLIGAIGDDSAGDEIGQAHLFDATTGALLQTFDDPTATTTDRFGRSVALDGDRVLIGAPEDDTAGDDVGQAHLFDALTGALLRTFDDPTETTADRFGGSVALDGDRVLIGADGDDTAGDDVGQAHLFDATTGALLRTFDDPTETTADRCGGSVALDGDRVLIGAWQDDTLGSDVGQAHLFSAATGALRQTFDDPTPTPLSGPDGFGLSVALGDERLAVGAPLDDTAARNSGQVHVYATPVPLPAGAWLYLSALGLGGLWVRRRHRV